MKKLFLKLVAFSVHHPKTVLFIVFAVTVFFLTQIPKIQIDTDPENMLSADEPVRVTHREVKRDFALHDSFVLGVVDENNPNGVFTPATLERIEKVSREILKIDGVIAADLISPVTTDDIQADEGLLRIEPLLPKTVTDQKTADSVREAALSNPILKDLLVSGDGKAIAIFIPIKEKNLSYRVSKEIEAIVESYGGGETYHITGLPVAEDTFGVEMFRQMGISAPMAGVLIFLLMLFFFRSFSLVLSSMMVAMATVIWSMGALIGAGFSMHIMSSMIPIFLMPIAVLDSIHILSEFHDRFEETRDRRSTILGVIDELFTPMFFTSLTSAVGFASLISTPIPPVRVFGAFVAMGIIVAWVVTIIFIPAWIMLLPERFLRGFGKASSVAGVMRRVQESLGHFAIRNSWLIIALSVVVLIISAYGITKTTVNDNPSRWFHSGHPLRVAERVLNSHFGGTYMAYLVLEGAQPGVMKEPATLAYIEDLQKELSTVDLIGKTTSLADVVKKVSFELNDEKPEFNAIPDTRKKAAQYLFLYEMSGDPGDLYHLVDPEYRMANIWVQLKSGDNQDMQRVERFVDTLMAKTPPPEGIMTKWAGLTYLNVVWQDKMVTGMLKALAGGAVTVFILMVILFRSPLFGFISMIPLSLTVAFIYGLIGFAGKDYDMPVAVLSSLTLGISIDFAIHLCQRTRQINKEAGDWRTTIEKLYDEPVRAIIRNMVVISMGFLPLFFSPLVPYQTVGFFFAAIMAVSGAVTLVVLPALMNVLRRRLRLE